jgi:7-carboxy-7-deazaguanine synthase
VASTGKELDLEDVTSKVSELAPYYKAWVCITGGEPLVQSEAVHEIVKVLKNHGKYNVEVFTNGTLPKPNWWTLVDSWVVDVKCPSTQVVIPTHLSWMTGVRVTDQVKFTVETEEDLQFTSKVLDQCISAWPRRENILVSPVIKNAPAENAFMVLEGNPWLQRVAEFAKEQRIRYSLQVHKVLWGNRKGV